MYLVQKVEGEEAVLNEATLKPPFGPGFQAEQVKGCDRMEIWGSSFDDPGGDFCLFRLFKGDQEVATVRQEGY